MDHSRFLPTIHRCCIPARGPHCYTMPYTTLPDTYISLYRPSFICVRHRTISAPSPPSFLPSLLLSLFTLLLGEAPSITSLPSKGCSRARARLQARIPVCALRIERTEFSMERGVRLVSGTVPSHIFTAILFTWNVC